MGHHCRMAVLSSVLCLPLPKWAQIAQEQSPLCSVICVSNWGGERGEEVTTALIWDELDESSMFLLAATIQAVPAPEMADPKNQSQMTLTPKHSGCIGSAVKKGSILPTAAPSHPKLMPTSLLPGGLDMLILNHVGKSYFNYFDGDVGHVQKLLNINFLSYVAMTVSALPMLKRSGGSIVVVSSMAGEWERGLGRGIPWAGFCKKHGHLRGGSSHSLQVFFAFLSVLMQSHCPTLLPEEPGD